LSFAATIFVAISLLPFSGYFESLETLAFVPSLVLTDLQDSL
jgi:hypothetical protein